MLKHVKKDTLLIKHFKKGPAPLGSVLFKARYISAHMPQTTLKELEGRIYQFTFLAEIRGLWHVCRTNFYR
jgi:hypothetical protein